MPGLPVTSLQILELVAAVVILGLGIWLYRKNAREDGQYGSQGAVILAVIAAILLIHGFGGLDYRPSATELEAAEQ